MAKSAQRWKRSEMAAARALGTERLPNSGSGQPDARVPGWALQIKTKLRFPLWLWAAVAQARQDCQGEERPAVVLVEVGQGRRAKRLVVVEWDEWLSLIGKETDPC